MEFDDIFKVLKFWRIFKNLKNFKSGGLRVKFKSIATVFALGFSGITYLFYGDIGVEALELTPQDQPILEACLSNHKSLNMSFQGRISNQAGCGCTAKMVTASVEEDYYNQWAQAHALMLYNYQEEWNVTTEGQQKQFEATKSQMFSALQEKSNMPPKRFSNMIDELHEIDNVCDREETYSEDTIRQVASLRPIGYDTQFASQPFETTSDAVVEIRLRGAQAPIRSASK